MSKPELGDIEVGDKVVIIQRVLGGNREITAEVTAAGRVWLTIASDRRMWRMRKDTQDLASGYGHGYGHVDRFVTPDQLDWERRVSVANAYLREQRILPDFDWDEQRLVLANLIRSHEGLPPI